ncbi:MAG TPA: IPT/TIG domain-containing protein [Polyangiaceae bacterium]
MRPGAVPLLVLLALASACGSKSAGYSAFDGGTDGGGGGGGDGGGDAASGACTAGQQHCGGACVDTTSSASNCGGCGNTCESGTCCDSTCVTDTSSCSFVVTGITPTQGNQNGGDWIKVTGAGFSTGMLVHIGTGVAPTLALDATHAIALTPPGLIGYDDVSVVSGTKTSTLSKAFLYVAGSVSLPWTEKPMSAVRGEDPGLAVLQDGRVLVAGGTTVPDDPTHALTSAELYTRSTDTVALAGGAMTVPRMQNAAVTLLQGQALVIGGAGWTATSGTPATSADLFDPTSNTFAPTKGPVTKARAGIRAVMAYDGRVVISSGGDATADVYDPVTDSFAQIPQLAEHTYGFMVRLRDGRVLLGAGDGSVTACEIFDPAQNKFIPAAPLNQGRSMLTAHTLPDGRVIVIGGSSISAGAVHVPLTSMELYDPAADKWTVAPYVLSTGRTWHASALVRDGTILVMGGYNVDGTCTPTDTVDQVDPVNGTVKPFGTLPHANTEWTAVTLLDGSVLGVGGGACGTPTALPSLDFLPGTKSGQ